MAWLAKDKPRDDDAAEEAACRGFGFLRGIRDRALAIEFRMSRGDSVWFAYSHLASWRHNPSVGLLLKFTDDVTTLVLIRGSNLSGFAGKHAVNLTDRGIQRHRITFIREMDEEELRKADQGEPTIDKIEVAEFESHEAQQEWLKKIGPAFLRNSM